MADRLGGANLGSVDAGFQLLEEFGMPDRWGSEFAMRYPATNEPLLRGLFPLGPIPLDRRANPSAARRRQVPFLFFLFSRLSGFRQRMCSPSSVDGRLCAQLRPNRPPEQHELDQARQSPNPRVL
jgi:hypothetical protein